MRQAQLARFVRASISTGEFTPNLVTVPNVELLEVGEDWETSTGEFTWDAEDLLSAVESQADPAVRTPVVKLGHVDGRFDGQPSFGRIEGLHVVNNGQTLVGDFVGVPAWLASVMPSAYPRRSIEGWFNYQAPVAGTEQWPFVLTACALLGAFYPAINTLEDLPILWGSDVPPMEPAEPGENDELVAASNGLIRARKVVSVPQWKKVAASQPPAEDQSEATQATEEAVSQTKPKKGKVQASTSVDNVRMAFYESLGPGQYWWWIRQVLVNPFQLVVDDDEGGLYLIDVTVDADDNITFADPQSVKVEYVAASDGQPAVAKSGQVLAFKYNDKVTAGARVRASSETEEDQEEQETDDVKLSAENLTALGLKEGASEEDINTAVAAKLAAASSQPSEKTEEETTEEETTEETTETEAPAETKTEGTGTSSQITVPDGMVLVDQAQWSQVQEGVAAALQMKKDAQTRERDEALVAAVKAGKFPPSRVDHYKTMWEADPVGAKATIDKLAPGLIPVEERGTAAETDPKVSAAQQYPESWKPHIVRATRGSTQKVRVVND